MIKDYLNIKKKNERIIFKSKKTGKRVMVVTWSDSDRFKSESNDQSLSHGQNNNVESDESKEVTLAYLLTFTKEHLAQGLLKCVISKITFLKSRKMRTCKDLVKIYISRSMTRMRKLICKTSVMIFTSLSSYNGIRESEQITWILMYIF